MYRASRVLCIGSALFGLLAVQAAAAPLGPAWTYRGLLKQNGLLVTSDGCDFEFSLWADAAGLTQIGVIQTVTNVPVTNGQFTVDTVNAGGEFGPMAFNGQERWLKIAVRCPAWDGVGQEPQFTDLTPRQRLTGVPYAHFALAGPGGGGGFWAVNGNDINNTNPGRVGIGTPSPARDLEVRRDLDGVVHAGVRNPNAGTVATALLAVAADDAQGSFQAFSSVYTSPALRDRVALTSTTNSAGLILGATAAAGDIGFFTSGLAPFNERMRITPLGDVGIGTTSPAGKFQVVGGDSLFEARVGIGTTTPTRDLEISRFTNGGAQAGVSNAHPGNNAFALLAVSAEGGQGSLAAYSNSFVSETFRGRVGLTSSTDAGLVLGSSATSGDIRLLAGGLSANHERVRIAAGGNVGIGSSTPAGPLHILRTGTPPGALPPEQNGLLLGSQATAGYKWVQSYGGNLAINPQGNNVGIGTTTPAQKLGVAGNLAVQDGAASAVTLYAQNWAGSGGLITVHNDAGQDRVYIVGDDTSSGAGSIAILDAGGNFAITMNASEGLTRTPVLEITGGSDLSEQFDVDGGELRPEPGMVVCIDARKPGKLVVSTRGYDRTVAGVISGAGGVKTGMLMGQKGSAADGESPVALSGRVYCRVDASRSSVEPGDLLTTSDTPGHAMKATDPARSHGCIIGKAMSALGEGEKGLVLILVSLQ